MFDDDDLFDLTDDPFEWERYSMTMSWSGIVRSGRARTPRVTLRKSKTSAAADCSAGSLANRRIAVSVYLARVGCIAK